ncbi:Fic family protein (plasmid) [Ampullimonas aquatilis]|uniref:Fic family protein n=1 Tax=Ampullimonas aquatilis TaxID=1341549 RepID=UPI003C77FDD8
MSPPKDNLSTEQRDKLESKFTRWRIAELAAQPVKGKFDIAHLKEVNRRIFQDLPRVGFDDVTPGVFRHAVPDGKDWMKNRVLTTVEGSFFVAYSRMDDAAVRSLNAILMGIDTDALRKLTTTEFTNRISKLYTELDYIHPFSDGNSRTLRTFTEQIANESGFSLNWRELTKSTLGRDRLYVARDIGVNQIAMSNLHSESSFKRLLYTQDRLGQQPDLAHLLKDVIRPSRALDFEVLPEQAALMKHPDLAPAYKIQRDASVYFASKKPNDAEFQKLALDAVTQIIQLRLNQGEKLDFALLREATKKEIETKTRGSDLER